MNCYRISGLHVVADLPLPGAIPTDGTPEHADIRVGFRPVPARLAAPSEEGPGWELDERHFLQTLPGSGRFMAFDGARLDLDPCADADPADLLPFVLGTGIGAILYQRGGMILHAASIERNGRAIALCGHSGSGKSTLAAMLGRLGCRLVSDDMAALTCEGPAGRPTVQPDGRCLKLYDSVINKLAMADRRLQPVRAGIGKHYVEPLATRTAPVPLDAIYVLRRPAGPLEPAIVRQPALRSAQILLNQSYRRRLALAMAQWDPHWHDMRSAVLSKVPIFSLARPNDLARLEEAALQLLDHWHSLEGRPE